MEQRVRTNSAQQDEFVFGGAFETLYGGKAGGGKTYALALAALLGVDDPHYSAILFRKTFPELNGKGSLIDTSKEFYPAAQGVYRGKDYTWEFPTGAQIRFSHMANKDDHYAHQGKQYHFVGFDELTHFHEDQYRYLFSRIRKRAGTGGRTRMAAASNPGARWVYERWRPWLDPDHPEKAAPGEIRWYRLEGEAEIPCQEGEEGAWSRTFIPASYKDNPDLDPEYERNLDLLPFIERQRLKFGDWRIEEGSGLVLNKNWFMTADTIPYPSRTYRGWDFAASEKKNKSDDPDWTATAYLSTQDGNKFYLKIERRRTTWNSTREWVKSKFMEERHTMHGGEEEGGASGKGLTSTLLDIATESGMSWTPVKPSTDKVARAQRWAPMAEQGRIILVTGGEPIENILSEFHSFPDGGHDDMVDAVSVAFELWSRSAIGVPAFDEEGEFDLDAQDLY